MKSNWFLGYMIECTPTGYYWPPVTYYGPRRSMWRVYDSYKIDILQFITLGHSDPRKGKNMNAITKNDAQPMVAEDFDAVVNNAALEGAADRDVADENSEEGVFVNDDGKTRTVN